jgi:photosystem II stability/assembly factor-like uncharacterized protein
MKTRSFIIVFGLFLMATLMAPLKAQWNLAYSNPGDAVYSSYFADSLNGWFTGLFTGSGFEPFARIANTTDGGYSFQPQQTPAGTYPINAVYMEDLQNGWAAGGAMYSNGPGVIVHTTDGGQTWVNQDHQKNGGWNSITKIGNEVWFCGGSSNGGVILKTSDNGQHWQVNYYPAFGVFADLVVIDNSNIIINCGFTGTLARSTDGGNTWIKVNFNTGYQIERIAFMNASIGYAVVTDLNSFPTDTYLYKTSDSGFTWNLHYSWLGHGQKNGISVIPATGTLFVGGYLTGDMLTSGIIKSTDSGVTWNTVLHSTTFVHPYLYTPTTYQGWAIWGGGYIHRYDYVEPPTIEPIHNQVIQFGEEFTYQVNATGIGLKYSLANQPSGLDIEERTGAISGTPQVGGTFALTVAVADTDANVVNEQFNLRVNRAPQFIGEMADIVSVQVNHPYNIQLEAEDVDDDTLSFSAIEKPLFLNFTPNFPDSNQVTLSGIPSLADTGYHSIKISVKDNYGGADTISYLLHVFRFNHSPIFVGTISDTLVFVDSLYQTTLQAADIDRDSLNFTLIQKPEFLSIQKIDSITARIFGTPAQSDTGLYVIKVKVEDGMGGADSLQFNLTVNSLTNILADADYPNEYSLSQNYPNPFNPSTRIQYQVSPGTQSTQGAGSISHVSLAVYDILGREVAKLVNEEKSTGSYEVEFSVESGQESGIRNLVSGIYFYRLQAGEYIETKKMILLR